MILEKSFLDIAVKNARVSKLYGYRVLAGRTHRSWREKMSEGPQKKPPFIVRSLGVFRS
jgi:hypothetical protein